MADYDPVPDAIDALQTKTQPQRFAIARLLDLNGPALEVLRWIVEQPDCDRTTASMVFWRLLRLTPENPQRVPTLDIIRQRMGETAYGEAGIAWDGLEAWDRTPLISASAGETPPGLFGPFDGETPEPATHAFFDAPYEDQDSFDSLWRKEPYLAAAADWLIGKSAEVWMAAVTELYSGHANDLYRWIVQQPECPAPVAGQIFWMADAMWYSQGMLGESTEKPEGVYAHVFELLDPLLDRWRTTGFVPSDLDFSGFARPAQYRALLSKFPGKADPLEIPAGLLDPVPGRKPAALRLCGDFNFWCIKCSFGGLVPHPRAAAVKDWQQSLKPHAPAPASGWRWKDLFRHRPRT